MSSECRGRILYPTFLCLLLAAIFSLAGCTNPEKAKAEHLSKGDAYLAESRWQEAALEYRNALQIDDSLAAAHWGLARAYEKLQRFPEMFDELRKTKDLDPKNLEARNKLGNYYLAGSQGDKSAIKEAENLANDVLQKDPNNIEGHILLGSVLFANGDKENAEKELQKAVDLDTTRVESYLSLARFYHVAGQNVAKAEETFKKAISINPNSGMAHTEYGKFLVQVNRPQEAEAELRKGVDVAPKDRDSRFVLASFYMVNKQFDKAEAEYKAMADLEPNKPESQAVLADFYSSVNRTDDAVRIYQSILSKSPDYTQGRYRLAEILLLKGDTQGANAQVEEALKKDKSDRQALLLRARLRSQSGDSDGLKAAVEDLKEVLRQEPNSRAGLYFMAQTNVSLGLMDQARAYSGDLEKNYPAYLPGRLLRVQITLSSGDAKGALALANSLITDLDKAVPDNENSPQLLSEIRQRTYLARGTAQMQLGNLAAARKDFESARDTLPNDPSGFNNLAIVSMNESKPQDGIAFFEAALKLDPTNFVALNGLTTAYAKNKEFDKAHGVLDQAINANPKNPSLHYLKGQVYGYQRELPGAEAEMMKALEIDPNYLAAYSALGALFINTRQEERAIAEYQKITQVRPDNSAAYTMIGMLEDSRKNYDAAADSYRKALEKDPNSVIAANNLAWLYAVYGKGNLDEAIRLSQGVVQKYPNIAGFIDTLGWVYYKKNLYAASVEQLQKAVALDEAAARQAKIDPSPTYKYHLGEALKAKGDKDASRRALQESVKLGEKTPFPDLEDAKKALASL